MYELEEKIYQDLKPILIKYKSYTELDLEISGDIEEQLIYDTLFDIALLIVYKKSGKKFRYIHYRSSKTFVDSLEWIKTIREKTPIEYQKMIEKIGKELKTVYY